MLSSHDIEFIPFKGRGLEKMTSYLGDFCAFIESHPSKVKVLEIGCGYGQVLLELADKYPGKVELFGINKPDDSMSVEKALMIAAYKGTTLQENEPHRYPISFTYGDAGIQLPYPDDYFDLIISQVCIPYIEDKLNLLREVCRVLKIKGQAWLHVGFEHERLCDGSPYPWSTLEIYNNESLVDLSRYFTQFNNFYYSRRNTGSVLTIKGGSPVILPGCLISVIQHKAINAGFYGLKSVYSIDGRLS